MKFRFRNLFPLTQNDFKYFESLNTKTLVHNKIFKYLPTDEQGGTKAQLSLMKQ